MVDTIISNAVLYDSLQGVSRFSSIGIEDGIIKCIGNDEILSQSHSNTTIINANGKWVMPAFNDSHIHLWKVGSLLTHIVDLRKITSIEELLEILRSKLSSLPPNTWLIGRGINEVNLKENRLPTNIDLDKISASVPIYIIRTCAHKVILNSKAIQICQLTSDTNTPNGGMIYYNEQGKPNGILAETALGIVRPYLPEYSEQDYKIMTQAATSLLHQFGIVSVTDPAVHSDLLQAYKFMSKKKSLRLRLNAIPILLPDGDNVPLSIPEKYSDSCLKVDTVKFFADGGLSSQTAALGRHYKNLSHAGILRLQQKDLYQFGLPAVEKGFKIATHGIGDVAIDEILHAYASFSDKSLRHRIEHVGFPSKKHLEMMCRHNISAVMQPIFIHELADNFINYLDDEYLSYVYPLRSVLQQHIALGLSTDAPVVDNLNPLQGIQTAMERYNAKRTKVVGINETISLHEAIKGYTFGSAYINNDEEKSGTLQVGKFADIIFLSQNPFSVQTQDLHKIQVTTTLFNGEVVYQMNS